MTVGVNLKQEAQALPYEVKRDILTRFSETQLHKHLKRLFEQMEVKSLVEITHGPDEHGRDLVIKRDDPWGEEFVGIVVKKGDPSGKITAKSDDVIDDIMSQIGQAIAHPCFLKEIAAGSVRISAVWVVFVGTLTGGASERIEHEVKARLVRLFPLAWLVEKFTEFYPEVFFEGELSDLIQKRIVELETKQEFIRKPINLSDSYVEPWVSPSDISLELEDELLRGVLRMQKIPFQKLHQVIESGRKIILAGDPGTGKSTALAKIALDIFTRSLHHLVKRDTKEHIQIPILVKANDLRKYKDCAALVNDHLPSETLRERFQVHSLLVDGLDEVAPEHRQEVLKTAEDFSTGLACGLIVSSRKVEAIKDMSSVFDRYEVLPFEYDQAIRFVERLVSNRSIIQLLKDGLQRPDLKLSLTPLSLQLLIEVVENEREIPASITEVYERFMDIALGRHDHEKGIDSVFQYLIKKRFLAELAWAEYYEKDNILPIAKASFNAFLNRYIGVYGWPTESFQQFIAEIERAGILRLGEKVVFRHRSFLDYFVAFRLFSHREEVENLDEKVSRLYFSDLWTDVAFYYVGQKREMGSGLVSTISESRAEGVNSHILIFLIGRLLQAGWHTPSEIKKQAISVALQSVEPIYRYLSNLIAPYKDRVPAIFPDFFLLALSQYSFGSKTVLQETLSVSDSLLEDSSVDSIRKAVLLLWANRERLSASDTKDRTCRILANLTSAEKRGELTVHDKAITLLMLKQIEQEDKKLLRSIGRKFDNVKRGYPDDMRRLLPVVRKGFRKRQS